MFSVLQHVDKAFSRTSDFPLPLYLLATQEINPTLYYMQRQRLVTKVTESPPAWTLNMANVVVHSNQKLNLTTGM